VAEKETDENPRLKIGKRVQYQNQENYLDTFLITNESKSTAERSVFDEVFHTENLIHANGRFESRGKLGNVWHAEYSAHEFLGNGMTRRMVVELVL
jgi:hypothetical protein